MVYHSTEWTSDGGTWGTFDDLEAAVLRAVRSCEGRKFDTIVVQGVSGMSIGFPLALKLGVGIAVVRKVNDGSHSSARIEGKVKGKKCLFVDDFVSEGKTKARVIAEVTAAGGKVVAQYTNREDHFMRLLPTPGA